MTPSDRNGHKCTSPFELVLRNAIRLGHQRPREDSTFQVCPGRVMARHKTDVSCPSQRHVMSVPCPEASGQFFFFFFEGSGHPLSRRSTGSPRCRATVGTDCPVTRTYWSVARSRPSRAHPRRAAGCRVFSTDELGRTRAASYTLETPSWLEPVAIVSGTRFGPTKSCPPLAACRLMR